MAVMLSETYEALREAGASEARARAAAEEIAAFESRLIRVETKLDMVLGGTVATIVGIVTLVVRSFMS